MESDHLGVTFEIGFKPSEFDGDSRSLLGASLAEFQLLLRSCTQMWGWNPESHSAFAKSFKLR